MRFDTIIGVDPSLRSTGICALRSGLLGDRVSKITTGTSKRTLLDRWARYEEIVTGVKLFCRVHGTGVLSHALVLIEGYSMGSKGAAFTQLIESGTLLRRFFLKDTSWTVLEIAPAALKKFVTGKGGGAGTDKTGVAMAAFKRWSIEHGTSDETDAHCLALLGAYAVGLKQGELPAANQSVVDDVRAKLDTGDLQ